VTEDTPPSFDQSSSDAPERTVWTPRLVKSFWDGLAQTRLLELGFSRLAGPHLLATVGWHLSPDGCYLDFGAGDGDFVQLLIENGFSAAGLEPSRNRALSLERRLSGRPGFLGVAAPEGDEKYDGVFLIEVVEHVLDDESAEVMAAVRRRLKPGGLLIITTPNREDLELGMALEPSTGKLFHRWQHVRSFTPEGLDSFLTAHGFAALTIHQIELTDRIFGAHGAGLGVRPELQAAIETPRPLWIGDGSTIVYIGIRQGDPLPEQYRDIHPGALWPNAQPLHVPAQTSLTFPPGLLAPASGDWINLTLSRRTFVHDSGYCWVADLPERARCGDNAETGFLSNSILMEDNAPLGPPHALHEAIRTEGRGAFSHWGHQLFFSTSDNSSPQTNGRKYVLRFRPRSQPAATPPSSDSPTTGDGR
jgi:SAM-dependent methyltransferase